MTLVIHMWDPDSSGSPCLPGDRSFGFERYRFELWGSSAVCRVGAQIIPRLATDGEVFIVHADLPALEDEARRIADASESIAAEVFVESEPGRGVVIVREGRDAKVRNAWGGTNPSESIRRYVGNLIRAIECAREAGCGVSIG
jgi:hypothetical protein